MDKVGEVDDFQPNFDPQIQTNITNPFDDFQPQNHQTSTPYHGKKILFFKIQFNLISTIKT
jgi:hypothetical protein